MAAKTQVCQPANPQTDLGGTNIGIDKRTRGSLHVKNLPTEVLRRARINANLSDMRLKHYIIRLLAESVPFVPASPIAATLTDEPRN
jgi:hypothetical protein